MTGFYPFGFGTWLIALLAHFGPLQYGFDGIQWALLLNRVVLGLFFVISGSFKLLSADRHKALVATLVACGIPQVWFCQWFVPAVELASGLGVLSGILAPFASLGMICILVVALRTDGPTRIRAFMPINRADWVSDLLYLSESEFLAMAAIVLFAGPGTYTLPWLLASLGI